MLQNTPYNPLLGLGYCKRLGKKRTRTTQGKQALNAALLEAGWAASKTRTFLGSKFWSVAGRKSKKIATVVIAHKIVVIAYHVLKPGEPNNKLSTDYLETHRPISTEELMIRRLIKQGYTVTKSNDEIA
ncbi:hypothetical protein LLE49_24815 [Alicyclobacillus tolerans]|uniref:hypothetical protein n=1 Tax=Alicyclobacillus tolerans TaxID=90970 RepID=UPI001F234B5B|nr:hypothetical protein [Alicyclobacillus tolerans]MCF8567950.1 hypothetical protein [Alicyclobacillus tolerans]